MDVIKVNLQVMNGRQEVIDCNKLFRNPFIPQSLCRVQVKCKAVEENKVPAFGLYAHQAAES